MEQRETIRKHLLEPAHELSEELVREHCSRMEQRYFESFELEEMVEHCRLLGALTPQNPIQCRIREAGSGMLECTISAFDNPFVFSLIAGTLSAGEFDISSGKVFTWKRKTGRPARGNMWRRRAFRESQRDPYNRRRIIDTFSGQLSALTNRDAWERWFSAHLRQTFELLEQDDPEQSGIAARKRVNQLVAERLPKRVGSAPEGFLPMEIRTDNSASTATRISLLSQDTPFFLYSAGTALSLQGLSIEHIDIKTIQDQIRDTIDVTDAAGHKIESPDSLNRIKLSALLTKQFTYFLPSAPDPFSALTRFETIVQDLLQKYERHEWVEMLSEPRVLADLAKLLGTSDYLWEDFIRQQYDSLLPMLSPARSRRFAKSTEDLSGRLEAAMAGIENYSEWIDAFNRFKDREIFLIDLDHILHGPNTFDQLAEHLTVLAETVVDRAATFVYGNLASKHGHPLTVGGLPATHAIFGLGKLGGRALGYASDIELLLVYGDNGRTGGDKSIINAEFFDHFAKEMDEVIKTKRDGIFALDWRLRPYGKDGPLGCSLESFCRYYVRGGDAHSYERLALVRLRHIAGDRELGARVERLRDEFVYTSKSINPRDILELRKKQYKKKALGPRPNAKFSRGGLVDLEYDVQLLQIQYGDEHTPLRTPHLTEALSRLSSIGVLEQTESQALTGAYAFLRQLINALRMLRGSALDLFLPPADSIEYIALARRMGYVEQDGLSPASRLSMDFDRHTARIRLFVERRFGRDSLPGIETGNCADIVLSESLSDADANAILARSGFDNAARALVNVKALAELSGNTELFSSLIVPAVDMLRRKPDMDMALNNWERFARALRDPASHFAEMLSQPRRLDVLLSIFASSQWLANTLILNPDFFEWVADPDILHDLRGKQDIVTELTSSVSQDESLEDFSDRLRRIRRREILRIGTRDICLKLPLSPIMAEISATAEACVEATLSRIWNELPVPPNRDFHPGDHFCVLAYGKLGGKELNYSSDIDLLGLFQLPESEYSEGKTWNRYYDHAMEILSTELSRHTAHGYAYRVDTRLRPHGRAGSLSYSIEALSDYYHRTAADWEIQALLKAASVAGNADIARSLLDRTHDLLCREKDPSAVAANIEKLRTTAARTHVSRRSGFDVKNGRGGIRDIEFLVQGLQLIHAGTQCDVLTPNTLQALEHLARNGLLPNKIATELARHYTFLRRCEHFLQLMEDRQVHALPIEDEDRLRFARRVVDPDISLADFDARMNETVARVHELYSTYLLAHR